VALVDEWNPQGREKMRACLRKCYCSCDIIMGPEVTTRNVFIHMEFQFFQPNQYFFYAIRFQTKWRTWLAAARLQLKTWSITKLS
jgi:hypothetical protein